MMMMNSVSHFGGDPVTQLIFLNVLKIAYAVLLARRTIHVYVTRPLVLRMFVRDHAQAAGVWKTDAIKWSYQPKHSPSPRIAILPIKCVRTVLFSVRLKV